MRIPLVEGHGDFMQQFPIDSRRRGTVAEALTNNSQETTW
jgi:hypothetical protein